MNLKIKPDVHQEFKIAAELKGSTMSNLLHQFIVQTIWEEKKKHPEAFVPAALIPLEFENPVIPDGSDAPDYADELPESDAVFL